MGNSEYVLQFGLAQESLVDVSVYWPASRRRVDYLGIQAGQVVHLYESDGCDATNCTGTSSCELGFCWAQIDLYSRVQCCQTRQVCTGEPFETHCLTETMRIETEIARLVCPSLPPPLTPATPVDSVESPAAQTQPAVYVLATLFSISLLVILSYVAVYIRRRGVALPACPTFPNLALWRPRFEKLDSDVSLGSLSASISGSNSVTPQFSDDSGEFSYNTDEYYHSRRSSESSYVSSDG